jgi:hypothetical protein
MCVCASAQASQSSVRDEKQKNFLADLIKPTLILTDFDDDDDDDDDDNYYYYLLCFCTERIT